jgi:Ca2+-binding EF-hand superfamily protein
MRTQAAVFLVTVLSVLNVQSAPPPPAVRLQHADQNKDGVVTPREMKKEVQLEKRHDAVVNTPWEKQADANGDGRVEPAEMRAYRLQVIDVNRDGKITVEERRAYYVTWKRVVNTEVEKKYDMNGDGYLQWPEAREFLKDRLTIINTDGKAIVSTDIEREFDGNGDGVIDASEAVQLKEVLE